MPNLKPKTIMALIAAWSFSCIGPSDASTWNGHQEMAGDLPAGAYSIPFIRVQWDATTFSHGHWVVEYQYGKPLTATEKQNIRNLKLTASESKDMAIYQVGDLLFLLPDHFIPIQAAVGMDGSAEVTMGGTGKHPSAMSYVFSIGTMAQSGAGKWMPWVESQHVAGLQAAPLYHHKVSAFRYLSKGLPINGVAYYQPHQEFLQVMKFLDTGVSHAEKTQVLNFFLSNYVYHKS